MRNLLLLLLLLAPRAEAGFWKVTSERGAWWLVDPQGKKIFSRGVCGVSAGVALDRFDPAAPAYCALRFYPSAAKWSQTTLERIRTWGFNALGAGCDGTLVFAGVLPYTMNLGLGAAVGVPYADPSALAARTKIRELLAPALKFKLDQNLVGYCLDGALGWWDESVFLHVLRQGSAKDALKGRLMELVEREYRGDLRRFLEDFVVEPQPRAFVDISGPFKRAWFRPGRRPLVVEEFLEGLARTYYRTVTEELRKVDSNHLVIGDRYAGFYAQPVARVAGEYVDVVSVTYDTFAPQGWASPFYLESLARLARKPVLVSETYFAAKENRSGDRNRNGPYMTVPTQEERAAGASSLVLSLAKFPSVIGVHWFQYADQPPESDGEDFNMGLVDIKDVPYRELTTELAKAAPQTERVHGTWPAAAGLARSPQGLKVPALTDLPIVNGSLDEWPLEQAWVPGVSSVSPFERFGDIYVAWRPEGLVLAVVYMDYRSRQRGLEGPETDTERLTLGAGVENEKPVVFTLKGIQERADPDRPESAFRTPEVLAVRGGVTFPPEGRFLVAQGSHGMTRIVEVLLPAAIFRRERLDPSEAMRMTVSLRLRANYKELFWPRPFKVSAWDSSDDWVPLVLQPAAADFAVSPGGETARPLSQPTPAKAETPSPAAPPVRAVSPQPAAAPSGLAASQQPATVPLRAATATATATGAAKPAARPAARRTTPAPARAAPATTNKKPAK